MRLPIIVVLTLCLASVVCAAPDLYTMTDLGPGLGYGINSRGDVVGLNPYTHDTFVIPCGGTATSLGQISLDTADINDAGHVIGSYPDTYWEDASSAWILLGESLLRLTDPGYSRAWEMNNQDQVVGRFGTGSGLHAFVWSALGGMVDLGTLGGSGSVAYGLNDAGEVVGMAMDAEDMPRMFRWTPNTGMVDLGATMGIAYDLNEVGQIVAFGSTPAGYGTVIYQNGTFQRLPTPNFTPRRINNAGVVIGTISLTTPMVWDAVHGTRRMNNIIDPATNPGIVVRELCDINDRGDIVGYGIKTSDGTRHIVLLTGDTPDTTPPVISNLTVDPATLWPPRDDLRQVTVFYDVTDDRDPAPTAAIASITCNQTLGDGDAVIVDAHQVTLRATRSARDAAGRIYTITVEARDAAGNAATATATVTVPRMPAPRGHGVAAASAAATRGGTVAITATVLGDCELQATILNMAGVRISTLAPIQAEAGTATILWNGVSDRGTKVPNGRYLVRLTSHSADGAQASAIASLQLMR